jgi:hypothetical protein
MKDVGRWRRIYFYKNGRGTGRRRRGTKGGGRREEEMKLTHVISLEARGGRYAHR